jgi:hypothetical protein
MKKRATLLFLSLLLAGATGALRAQDLYHPITDGCSWSVSNEKYMTAGDTVLDGKTYLKLYRQVGSQPFEFNLQDAEFFAAIRDDSAERKVYAYLPAGTWIRDLNDFSETRTENAMEVLVYDFSLNIGDTVNHYVIGEYVVKSAAVRVAATSVNVGWSGYSSITHQYSEEDSVVVLSDNSTRNMVFLHGIYQTAKNNVWIDGVGSIRGFDEGPQIAWSDYGLRTLLCFSDNLDATFQTEFDFDNASGDCFNNGFGGDVPENSTSKVNIYPNPAMQYVVLEKGTGEKMHGSVVITDVLGRQCLQQRAEGAKCQIELSDLPVGMYFLTYSDGERTVTRKFMKK